MSTLVEKQLVAKPAPAAQSNLLVLWVMRFLALLASAVSGYLVWVALSAGNAVGCGGAMDCNAVLSSSWSKWFGLPVSIPAFSMYLTLLFVLVLAGPLAPENVRRLAWTLITAMTALAAAAALWFVSLQFFVIHEFCTWCFTIHVSGCGLFLLTLVAGRISLGRKLLAAAGAAAIGMAVLVTGQFLQKEQGGAVVQEVNNDGGAPPVRFDDELFQMNAGLAVGKAGADSSFLPDETDQPPTADSSADAANDDGEDGADGAATADGPADRVVSKQPQRIITVLAGKAELNAYRYPAVGPYDADHVIVELFDYTCPYCRQMYHHLEKAREIFGDQIVILLLPAPLCSDCNPHIHRTGEEHKDACQLAALSLALWRIDPEQFPAYHRWLMTGDRAPSAADARAKAEQLVGADRLAAELADPRLQERLAIGVQLYALAKLGKIPKLLLPHVVITYGPSVSGDEVLEKLEKHLGARRLQ